MRQRDDKMLAELLNRLRTRQKDQPLLASDESVLKSRVVGQDNELSAPSDALHIYARNTDVNRHNDDKLKALDTETRIITAIDTIQDGTTCKQLETPYETNQNDSPLVRELKLAVGARAMLITNVDVSDGLTLTPSPPFSFLAYLLGKGGVKKWGFPLGFEPGTPRTTMHFSPMARHSGVAARAAISFPYETRFYDVMGLFLHFPLLDFVGLWTVRVK